MSTGDAGLIDAARAKWEAIVADGLVGQELFRTSVLALPTSLQVTP